MNYPRVLDEVLTIERLLKGDYKGLCRFGDGDFNVIRGRPDRFQKWDPGLAAALAESLHRGSNQVLNCLVPPPTAEHASPMRHRWDAYLEANAGIIPFLEDELYGSSNVSRMDSCPHLHTTSWYQTVARLWQGKDICLVRGSDRSLTQDKLLASPNAPKSVTEVITPSKDGWDSFEQTFQDTCNANRKIIVLCAGLVVRPLVHRLVAEGLHAYDLGHFGMWFKDGQPIPLQECLR